MKAVGCPRMVLLGRRPSGGCQHLADIKRILSDPIWIQEEFPQSLRISPTSKLFSEILDDDSISERRLNFLSKFLSKIRSLCAAMRVNLEPTLEVQKMCNARATMPFNVRLRHALIDESRFASRARGQFE